MDMPERRRLPRPHPFWDSEDGQRHKDFRRNISVIRLSADVEPPTKNPRKRAASQNLQALLLKDALLWHGLDGEFGARWPRLRAPLAVDLTFSSTERNPPGIHTLSKAALDLLGGSPSEAVLFKDDRQIKMLFARAFRDSKRPTVSVEAQTLAQTLAGVRRATTHEYPWRPAKANYDIAHRRIEADRFDEDMADWYKDDVSAFGQEQYLRLTFEDRLKVQSALLAFTDHVAANVVTAYASERERAQYRLSGTAHALGSLLQSGYAFNLGPLPSRGQSKEFKRRVTAHLQAAATTNPRLFPLLSAVGVTLFYVESKVGKDLDNIFLDVLPIVFKHLQPPEQLLSPWAPIEKIKEWDAALKDRRRLIAPGVGFIEAVALQNVPDMPYQPGTVIMALSHGARYESWWANANSYVRDGYPNDDDDDY